MVLTNGDLINGDAYTKLQEIKNDSIDLIVTDPPYGIEFMGKDWDKVLISTDIWKECYRVLKYGKLAFVMCLPRQDVLARMIINLQDAGFRVNYSSIYHTFASGFPKAKNNRDGSYSGWQPKPALEIILVVSKGKTLTWIDDCRIPYQSEDDKGNVNTVGENGRFPANLLISDDILNNGKITKGSRQLKRKSGAVLMGKRTYSNGIPYELPEDNYGGYNDKGGYSRYFSLDAWAEKTLPFLIIPKASKSERNKGCEDLPQVKNCVGDDRPSGQFGQRLDGRPARYSQNHHPTVKPLKLMSYIITLGSREDDLVLDPFCGSGTTCVAANQLHRKWIGIEINQEYIEIARARINSN